MPEPQTDLENSLGMAVRRATGTSSDRIFEHLANATSRLPAAKNSTYRDRAINEYGKWNENTKAERSRVSGEQESQKSQDADRAYKALLEWQEGSDDPEWQFLINGVSKSALQQAQIKLVRDISRTGISILNANSVAFADQASDQESYAEMVMQQGYLRMIQEKGLPLPFDVVSGWAQSLNEAGRISPQFVNFNKKVQSALNRQDFESELGGIRSKGVLDRARTRESNQTRRRTR